LQQALWRSGRERGIARARDRMLNRWIGTGALLLMLAGNASLFVYDILPRWTAGSPPRFQTVVSEGASYEHIQTGIFDSADRNIGRSWTLIHNEDEYISVASTTLLDPIVLPEGLNTPAVRIETDLRFGKDDQLLNELSISLHGLPVTAMLQGELIPPDQFACRWHVGARRGMFVFEAGLTRAFGDVLRPFTRLPNLHVGQTWRLQLMNPLSKALPGWNSAGPVEEPEIVRVTGTEMIEHGGRSVEAFVVEAPRLRAWVAPDGAVLRQEIEFLPLLGRLVLRDEPFDDVAYEKARVWRPAE
jgi:hypothetical protein